GVLLLSGEAGGGKTRILRAAREAARGAGFLVLEGACFEADRAEPYAPLLDLLHAFLAATSPAVVAHAFAPAAPELLTVFPELRPLFPEVAGRVALDPEQDRRRLFHALASTLHALARTQPLVIIVEDVHWSDDATLDLLLHLGRGLAGHPLVLALSYRSDEVGPRLAGVLSALDRARVAAEVSLARLDAAEVAAMVRAIFGEGAALGDAFVASLHALTDGNPFFVEEVLKALVVAGDLAPEADGGWRARPLERVHVPRTAVEAVRRRLSGLSEAARNVASMAAVAGRRFDFALIQTLTGLDERTLLGLVRELVDAQLVVEESADLIAFRHALTREAIYAELLARERVLLHREVAGALERLGGGAPDAYVDALAYHTYEAGDWPRAGPRAPVRAGPRARDARRVRRRPRRVLRRRRRGARRRPARGRVERAARPRDALGRPRLRPRRRVPPRGARARPRHGRRVPRREQPEPGRQLARQPRAARAGAAPPPGGAPPLRAPRRRARRRRDRRPPRHDVPHRGRAARGGGRVRARDRSLRRAGRPARPRAGAGGARAVERLLPGLADDGRAGPRRRRCPGHRAPGPARPRHRLARRRGLLPLRARRVLRLARRLPPRPAARAQRARHRGGAGAPRVAGGRAPHPRHRRHGAAGAGRGDRPARARARRRRSRASRSCAARRSRRSAASTMPTPRSAPPPRRPRRSARRRCAGARTPRARPCSSASAAASRRAPCSTPPARPSTSSPPTSPTMHSAPRS
ncbi:MAG: AAA family ATPase, partial [Gemmatimonadetes bacterium]|nr:AAA family ATPase [Gemmatimonadota bacterium]